MAMWCGRVFFFFNDTATTEIYTLSLHDALPIALRCARRVIFGGGAVPRAVDGAGCAIQRSLRRSAMRDLTAVSLIAATVRQLVQATTAPIEARTAPKHLSRNAIGAGGNRRRYH